MRKLILASSLVLAALTSSSPAFAKAHSEWDMPEVKLKAYYSSESEYKAALEAAKTAPGRMTAAVDAPAVVAELDPDFKALSAALIGTGDGVNKGVKSPKELDALIDRINSTDDTFAYNKLGHEAQFLALQVRALKPFKSFFYRARTYVGTHTVMRASIVSLLRTQAAFIQDLYPVSANNPNHWQVVYDYLTIPQDNMGPEVKTDADFAQFVGQLSKISTAITNDYAAWVKEGKDIWWDNKLYLSFANFTSEKDQYVRIGRVEQETMLAAAYMNLSALYAVRAHSLDGLQASVADVGTLFGIGTPLAALNAELGPNGADGISSRSRMTVLKQHSQLFSLVDKTQMQNSFTALQYAMRMSRVAWQEITSPNYNAGAQYLFDARVVLPFNRILGMSFEQADNLLTSNGTAVNAVVNGDNVKVNLPAFFTGNQSLSAYYPQTFVNGPKELSTQVNGQTVSYRNYQDGMAKTWLCAPYKAIFPDIKCSADGKYTQDVPRYARVLAQTWGGAGFALPLAGVLF